MLSATTVSVDPKVLISISDFGDSDFSDFLRSKCPSESSIEVPSIDESEDSDESKIRCCSWQLCMIVTLIIIMLIPFVLFCFWGVGKKTVRLCRPGMTATVVHKYGNHPGKRSDETAEAFWLRNAPVLSERYIPSWRKPNFFFEMWFSRPSNRQCIYDAATTDRELIECTSPVTGRDRKFYIYWVDGKPQNLSKPIMLCLPGLGSGKRSFERDPEILAEACCTLRKDYHCVYMTYPGMGEELGLASKDISQCTIYAFNSDMEFVLNHLQKNRRSVDPHPMFIAASSYGTAIFSQWAAVTDTENPGSVESRFGIKGAMMLAHGWCQRETLDGLSKFLFGRGSKITTKFIKKSLLTEKTITDLQMLLTEELGVVEAERRIQELLDCKDVKEWDRLCLKLYGKDPESGMCPYRVDYTKIGIPILLLNARNDPISPAHRMRRNKHSWGDRVTIVETPYGTHLAYEAKPTSWFTRLLSEYASTILSG